MSTQRRRMKGQGANIFSVLILGVVAVVVGVLLVTSQAPTITDNTNTDAGGALENVSESAKSIYGLYDFIWATAGLVLIVGGIALFGLAFTRRGGK